MWSQLERQLILSQRLSPNRDIAASALQLALTAPLDALERRLVPHNSSVSRNNAPAALRRGGARQLFGDAIFLPHFNSCSLRPHFFDFFDLLGLPGIKALKAVSPSGVIRYFQPPAPSGFRSIQPFPSIMKIVDAPAGYSCAAGNQPAPNKAWSARRSRYVGIWPARPGIMSWT